MPAKQRHPALGLLVIAVLAIAALAIFRKSPAPPKELHGHAMGVRWTFEWHGESPPPAELKQEISGVLEKWEQVLSQWRPTSDLSRHNRGEPATPELARVIALADEIKQQTNGAFDHHILEKVHAAGFGPEGTGIDLSSIGKGFAVDRVHEHLKSRGMRDFVFALAGEVRADGEWPVGLEAPVAAGSTTASTVVLKNRAIATSGNYRQFRETSEGIVSHIIDPRTGKPVIRPLSGVSVIAPDCATASSWATALFVLGPDFKNYPADFQAFWQTAEPAR